MEPGKKISFGFMKTNRKIEKPPVPEKKDYIECVEEKAIKVVGGDEVKEIAPLVIKMKPNTLVTTERLKEIAARVENSLEEPDSVEEPPEPMEVVPQNETLEQMAVRELLEESKKTVEVDAPQLKLVLPAKSVSSGEKESTLDDYESVPVQEFGLAMLRGMGWSKTNEKSTFKQPALRPKGLGLGADKVIKDNNKQKESKSNKDEDLNIVENAYVKITTGKHSGFYGKTQNVKKENNTETDDPLLVTIPVGNIILLEAETESRQVESGDDEAAEEPTPAKRTKTVVSLDEDNGRVMVDITVKKETVSLSEFMMHPVTKSEFDKESKVINAGSFDQYKKNEEQRHSRNERESKGSDRNNKDEKQRYKRESSSIKENNNHKRIDSDKKSENRDSRERNRDRSRRDKSRHSSEEKHNRNKKKYSSNDSLSESDTENNKKQEKSKKRSSSMESLDSDAERKKERRKDNSRSNRSRKNSRERKRYDSSSDLERNYRRNISKDRKRDDSKLKQKESKVYDSDSESNQTKSKKSTKDRKRNDSDSEPEERKSKKEKEPDSEADQRKSKKDNERKRHDSGSESDRVSKKSIKDRKRNDSDSNTEERKIKKNKERKKYESDSESDHGKRKSSSDGKRDIDKKRKGKKKKRDRDRSPNYRKHRK